MKFGVREICNVVLRAKATQKLGSRTFYKNEPVLYFDTLKTSSLEGAATTVYAQGGRGNSRLIAWEGERTLTFTMEDALISPEGFSILSGADLIAATDEKPVIQHVTDTIPVAADGTVTIPDGTVLWNGGRVEIPATVEGVNKNLEADIYVMILDENGNIDSEPIVPSAAEFTPAAEGTPGATKLTISYKGKDADGAEVCMNPKEGQYVFVDYYVKRVSGAQQIEITAEKFGGNYYLEADTLFRRESDGVDMPAEFIIPNCKVQSNFTFSMASTGDPSTFTFTLDAFPDYVKFDRSHKVLAAIQIIEDETGEAEALREICKVGE